MGIFSKKRKDGTLVTEGDPMIHIMPYVMRGRNESAVYYTNTIDIDHIQKYIKERRKDGVRLTVFNVIMAAVLQVFHSRPNMNRFVAGRRLYAHHDVEILYTVKIELNDDSFESVARVKFDADDNLETVTRQMEEQIALIKAGGEGWDDKLIRYFSRMPRWFLRSFLGILRWLDFHGLMPKALIDIIPMYSSMFISHLGSIGGDSAFHHLYEFGTTSIFMTISKVYEKPFKTKDGGVEWRKVIDLNFTIDERIVDGYYLIKSMKMFNLLLSDMKLLEYSPNELQKLVDSGEIKFGSSKVVFNDRQKSIAPLEAIVDQQTENTQEHTDLLNQHLEQ